MIALKSASRDVSEFRFPRRKKLLYSELTSIAFKTGVFFDLKRFHSTRGYKNK